MIRDRSTSDAQIGDEMTEVVFFLRADRAVGQHDEEFAPRQAADGAIGVDPRIHGRRGAQFGTRRPQFGRDDQRLSGTERVDEIRHGDYRP